MTYNSFTVGEGKNRADGFFANVETHLKSHTRKYPLEVEKPETYLHWLSKIHETLKHTSVVLLAAGTIKDYEDRHPTERTGYGLAAYNQFSTPFIFWKDEGIVVTVSQPLVQGSNPQKTLARTKIGRLTNDQVIHFDNDDDDEQEGLEIKVTIVGRTKTFSVVNGGVGYEVDEIVISTDPEGLKFSIKSVHKREDYLCQYGCILGQRLTIRLEDVQLSPDVLVIPMLIPTKRETTNRMRSRPLDTQRTFLFLLVWCDVL
jgi:hypothetical protein